jgi:peptidoglycan/xylan/chitin deacetylase (PgdA/CDA1 family)
VTRGGRTVAFTVDVEPDCPPFLRGFRGMEQGMPALLDLLATRRIAGTFFTTGEVAARYPAIVERIVREGHELACHGMTHRAFTELAERDARDEIESSVAILRAHAPVTSFRAPYLKFPSAYLPMLEANGFTLDSSHAVYKPAYYRDRSKTTLTRVPASVMSSVLRAPRWLRDANLALVSDPLVLFVHPWEFVDLGREPLRWDCRFRTGDFALRCVGDVLAKYSRAGAQFVRMRELAA